MNRAVKLVRYLVEETETHWLFGFTYSQEPPFDVIAPIIGDALHNARSALDVMLCDIARLRKKSTDKVKFPFAVDEEKLKQRLDASPYPRLGQDVREAILRVKPYREGGNKTLRKLSDLNNLDKHELLVPTIGTARIPTGFGSLLTSYGSTALISKIIMSEQEAQEELGPINAPLAFWFTNGNELDSEVVETLFNFAEVSEEVIEAFAAEFGT